MCLKRGGGSGAFGLLLRPRKVSLSSHRQCWGRWIGRGSAYLFPPILCQFDAVIRDSLVDISVLWPRLASRARKKDLETDCFLRIGRGVLILSSVWLRNIFFWLLGGKHTRGLPIFHDVYFQMIVYAKVLCIYADLIFDNIHLYICKVTTERSPGLIDNQVH